jgi:hypothetical protein
LEKKTLHKKELMELELFQGVVQALVQQKKKKKKKTRVLFTLSEDISE